MKQLKGIPKLLGTKSINWNSDNLNHTNVSKLRKYQSRNPEFEPQVPSHYKWLLDAEHGRICLPELTQWNRSVTVNGRLRDAGKTEERSSEAQRPVNRLRDLVVSELFDYEQPVKNYCWLVETKKVNAGKKTLFFWNLILREKWLLKIIFLKLRLECIEFK